MSIGTPPGIAPDVARRAVEWWLDLQSGDITDSQRRAFECWRAEHADHDRAWRHIQSVSQRLQTLNESPAASAARAALTRPRSPARRAGVKTLVLLFFAGGTAWLARDQIAWRGWSADLRTGTGEQRNVTLADGTRLMLDTASAVDVRFSDTERRIVLLRGEIMVVTGHDDGPAPRPFVAQTAQGVSIPLGTRFSLRQEPSMTRLDVFEGVVKAEPARAPGASKVVHAGERMRFSATQIMPIEPASADTAAWTQGMLVASNMRLGDFLSELGRYRDGYLRCDPSIADFRLSGTFPLPDTDRVLKTLATTLPVEVEYVTRYWVTVKPAR
ncbi:FecR domain-containing protein [Paraburkholderia caribensis]|uniref:FecR domain-containing protein n=1 Tax=Paraburkholderia caribensis TaxID=75105 RepID=UPI002866DACD|nr:FecR domain-containing protein [Paraburkholderia caribensis]MDR6382379.1 transmembrane sensor [Paraburkholderia caribensis]